MGNFKELESAIVTRAPLWVSKAILISAAMLFSVIGIALLKVSDQSIEDSQCVTHTQEVISTLEELQTIFLNAESSVRAHVVSGSAEYKDAFTQSVELLPNKINILQNLVSDNMEQVNNSIHLRELIGTRLAQMNATLSAF